MKRIGVELNNGVLHPPEIPKIDPRVRNDWLRGGGLRTGVEHQGPGLDHGRDGKQRRQSKPAADITLQERCDSANEQFGAGRAADAI